MCIRGRETAHEHNRCPMIGYTIGVSCLLCGGKVEHVNSAPAVTGTEAVAVVKCTECDNEFTATVHMRLLGTRRYRPRAVAS